MWSSDIKLEKRKNIDASWINLCKVETATTKIYEKIIQAISLIASDFEVDLI